MFDNISGRTTCPVDTTHNSGIEEDKDNSPNYKIPCTANPDDQCSTVIKNPSDNNKTVLGTKRLHESELSCIATNDSFTPEPQHVACTLLTISKRSNLQDQSTMMDYMEEPTCSSDVVIATEDEGAACITGIIQADIPSSVFEEMISNVHGEDGEVTGEFKVHEI